MSVLRLSIAFAVLTCICAQKPFYASSNSQYPSVLPQYLQNNPDVGNRIGETPTPDPFLGSQIDPVYNVEKELVDRIRNEYPRDKQPYWFVNAEQLNSIRFQQQPVGTTGVATDSTTGVTSGSATVRQQNGQQVVQRSVQPINNLAPTRRQQVKIQ